jgi:DNA-binding XRE family transcriptional regulator
MQRRRFPILREKAFDGHPITSGESLRIWRLVEMQMSQDEVAKELGYKGRNSISKLELGLSKINPRLSNAFENLSNKLRS